ncbi:very long chain fatty acid elongase 1-like isoform X1 [Lycorma delicatula]|uniref:very long chain fatty acid elongase 1-like isoform X1 n=1 Tax=Lycorma delicatula TaxID=130591 RepID=UPI003F510D3B
MCTWRWHNFCAKFHIAGLPTIEWVQHVCTPCYLLELLIFFVLRKKDNQISLLHLYHHSLTPIETWICVKFIAGSFTESEISFNDEVSPQINLNMKTTEFEINDLHTVKTEEKMEFYPGHM